MNPTTVAKCPYNPYSGTDVDDPYPTFAQAREANGVVYLPELGMFAATTRDAVVEAMRRYDDFSSVNATEPVQPVCAEAMAILQSNGFIRTALFSSDPPEHTVVRNAVRDVLSPRRVAALEPAIRDLVARTIDSFLASGTSDLLQGVLYPVPAFVILQLLGVEADDAIAHHIHTGSLHHVYMVYGHLTDEEQIEHAKGNIAWAEMAQAIVDERAADPRTDDVLTDLLQLSDEVGAPVFSRQDVTRILLTFFSAGHDTTTSLLANGIRHLLQERSLWERLCAEPDLIPEAVEELLRFDTSIATWRRRARRDTELAGVPIPKGSDLVLALASANRDATFFEDADSIDLTRPNARRHVSFGNGLHACLGASLARLEIRIVLEELTRRIPTLRIADDADLSYHPVLTLRAPQRLDVAFDGPTA